MGVDLRFWAGWVGRRGVGALWQAVVCVSGAWRVLRIAMALLAADCR